MIKPLRLDRIDDVGMSEEFHVQLNCIGKASDWGAFRDGFCLPGTKLDHESKQGLGRLFCQLNGITLISGNEVWLARIPKRSGYVARYVDLQTVLKSLNLEDEWNDFFLGSTYCLLDECGGVDVNNLAIYWGDAICFFEPRNLVCKSLLCSNQAASVFLDNVAANVSLSGFDISKEISELASLAANGIISTEEALERLKNLED
ncbi:antitoxin VbhA family protein [Amphritea balenae]|uniref:Uncharacterized protein n=1 Tax=Amphritea balenae TaxID=452629 RepID=A0A3P1SM92_9GAMM|nr:antitoxin VbhA family protein [Amphritea balenae]RRC98268.1 hypothetical protein EHS89_14345 [Amphritea balenae]GGK80511.1 hypothetical protein GCM10007941_33610 [Amphritea balenae]